MAANPRLAYRIARDLQDCKAYCDVRGEEFVEDAAESLRTFIATVPGPVDSPYAGKRFRVRCQLPAQYPMHSPSVVFLTPMWHPNIHPQDGAVCLNALNEDWSSETRLTHVVEVFIPYLLQYPNPSDPLNDTAASEMKRNPEEYAAKVRAHVAKHGMEGLPGS